MKPVWVMGAGSIGCFVGGRLAAAGAEVHFIGRPRLGEQLARHGLTLSDLQAPQRQLPAAALRWHLSAAAGMPRPGLVLLCVKSAATAQAAAELAAVLPAGTPVLSLQNGVDNTRIAQQAAPQLRLMAGMVPFNVAELGDGRFHRGSSGQLVAERHPDLRPWLAVFASAGLPLQQVDDMAAVQWAKLLLNLNNPVNALSGLPLRAQLLDAAWRRVSAALMREGLAVLRAAGIRPARLTPLPAHWLPALMRLPTPLFRIAAAASLRIDARARSSMADDLAHGRPPEIDALCGAVVRLGAQHGVPTPRNAAMLRLLQLPIDDLAARRADALRLATA